MPTTMERIPVDATTPDPVRILHLSDLHFGTRTQWDSDPILRDLARYIAADIASHDLWPDLVVITGDLAQSGKPKEYEIARKWLDDLWPRLTRDPGTPLDRDRLLLVPGNHDCDRDLIEPGARNAQTVLLGAKTQDAITEHLKATATCKMLLKRHAAYLKFYGNWLGQRQPLPWWQRSITIRDKRLHLAGLDSAWLADRDDDSRLLLGTWQINQTVRHRDADGAHDWRLALLHHPWASLAEFDRDDAQQTLHLHRDLILRGHLHQPRLFRILPADPEYSCIEAAAGCCYSHKSYPNAFQWLELARGPRRVRFHFRWWNGHKWDLDRNQPGCPDGTHLISLPDTDPPEEPFDPQSQDPPESAAIPPNSRRPADIPADAKQAIEDALASTPALCAALAKALKAEPQPAPIAERLCDHSADSLTVFDAQYQAAAGLAKRFRGTPDEGERLRAQARCILGWTTVMTVTQGHEREDCAVVRAWFEGGVLRLPLGRNPCVEVLTARWRGDLAEFGTQPEVARFGPDDITPRAFPEPGVDLADPGAPLGMAYIWQRVYEKLYGRRPDGPLTQDMKDSLRATVSGWRKNGGPRLRLVIDAVDGTNNPYASDTVLAAIHAELPDLYLIRVDSRRGGDPGVFVLAPAVLTARINMVLNALKEIP